MSVERMRRVDEAVREVLSDVLTHEVKDPSGRICDRHGCQDQP